MAVWHGSCEKLRCHDLSVAERLPLDLSAPRAKAAKWTRPGASLVETHRSNHEAESDGGIDKICPGPYTGAYGHGKRRRWLWLPAAICRAVGNPFPLRHPRRGAVRKALRGRRRLAEPAAGPLLPILLPGDFDGLDSERAIAWPADSLSIRKVSMLRSMKLAGPLDGAVHASADRTPDGPSGPHHGCCTD